MAAKGNLALDKRAQSTLAQRVTKVLGKKWREKQRYQKPWQKKGGKKKPTLAQRVTAVLAKKNKESKKAANPCSKGLLLAQLALLDKRIELFS